MPDDPIKKSKQPTDGAVSEAVSGSSNASNETTQQPTWPGSSASMAQESFGAEPTTGSSITNTTASSTAGPSQANVIGDNSVAATMAPANFGTKKSKKKLIIGIVSVITVMLAIGGGVGGYFLYQKPHKMLTNSFINAMTEKSSVVDATTNIETEAADVKVVFSAKGDTNKSGGNVALEIKPKGTISGMGTIKVNTDGVFDQDGTIYFKVNNVKSVVEKAVDAYINESVKNAKSTGVSAPPAEIASMKSQVMEMVMPIVNEVDNKWIKITPDDIKEMTGNSKDSFTCLNKATDKLQTDKAMSQELYGLYQKNRFITIKKELGSKDGNVGFEIAGNKAKAESFMKGVEGTALGRELKKCDDKIFSGSTDSTVSTADGSDVNVSVWVGKWSHTLNKVNIKSVDSKSKTNISIDMSAKYNIPVNIDVPKDAKSIKEVVSKIQSIAGDMYGGGRTTMPSPVSNSFKLGL